MGNSTACRARWNVTKHARRTAKARHEGRRINMHTIPRGYDDVGYAHWRAAYFAEMDCLNRAAFINAESNLVANPTEGQRIAAIAAATYNGL